MWLRVIEQTMFFVLGFLLAGLLALPIFPAVWKRALRLSRWQLEMQVPLSMKEIVAERDLVRASYAVSQRRIEQENEALRQTRAKDMAELGQRAVDIARLQADLKEALAQDRFLRLYDLQNRFDALTKVSNQQFIELKVTQERAAGLQNEIVQKNDELAKQQQQISAANTQLAALRDQFIKEKNAFDQQFSIERSDRAAEQDRMATRHAELENIVSSLKEHHAMEKQSLEAEKNTLMQELALKAWEQKIQIKKDAVFASLDLLADASSLNDDHVRAMIADFGRTIAEKSGNENIVSSR